MPYAVGPTHCARRRCRRTRRTARLVGLSGRTQFPHVHLSLRKHGKVVDPFRPNATCGGLGDDTLWADPPAYQPGGLLSAGLATGVPPYDAVKVGNAAIGLAQ